MGKRSIAFARAWEMTKLELVGSNIRLFISVVSTAVVSWSAYRTQMWLGREWPGDELIPAFLGPAVFISIFVVVLLFNWLLRTPYLYWGEVEARVSELERKLAPRFSVVPSVGQRPVYSAPQHVSVSVSGKVQSVRTLSEKFLSIEITNNSASTLRGCEAYLSQFQKVDGEEPGWHSMRLEWMAAGETGTSVDIPPLGHRAVLVFRVLGNRALFLTQQLPGDLVHYLDDKAEYQGLVTLTADGTPATFVAFILASDPEQEPTISVMRRNIGEEPSDMPWASETRII